MALHAITVHSFPQENFLHEWMFIILFSLHMVSFHFLYLIPNWQLINVLCGNTWNPCSYQLQPSAKLASWALDCKFWSLTVLYPNLLSPSLYCLMQALWQPELCGEVMIDLLSWIMLKNMLPLLGIIVVHKDLFYFIFFFHL